MNVRWSRLLAIGILAVMTTMLLHHRLSAQQNQRDGEKQKWFVFGPTQPPGVGGGDHALSALVTDLDERAMLDETLIVVMGEFGRTPKLNARGGRDHWPRVFSVALAGGGVSGGQVVGSSDVVGESPKDRPVTPSDLSATIYTLLGIDPNLELHTSDGRPVRVALPEAQVVRELVA